MLAGCLSIMETLVGEALKVKMSAASRPLKTKFRIRKLQRYETFSLRNVNEKCLASTFEVEMSTTTLINEYSDYIIHKKMNMSG